MLDARVVAFVGVAALLTIIPGADTLLVVRNSPGRDRASGLLTMLGICSGLFVHAIFSAAGVSAVVAHSAATFDTLKILAPVCSSSSACIRCGVPSPGGGTSTRPPGQPPPAVSSKGC